MAVVLVIRPDTGLDTNVAHKLQSYLPAEYGLPAKVQGFPSPCTLAAGRAINAHVPPAMATAISGIYDGFPVGLVVRVRQGHFSWWPAFIVDRKEREKQLRLQPAATLPAATDDSRMVKYFNDCRRVAVLEVKDLLEYSTNIRKVYYASEVTNHVIDACEQANTYIKTQGLPVQGESLQQMNFTLK